jgi:hypothetical protein
MPVFGYLLLIGYHCYPVFHWSECVIFIVCFLSSSKPVVCCYSIIVVLHCIVKSGRVGVISVAFSQFQVLLQKYLLGKSIVEHYILLKQVLNTTESFM